MPPSPSPASLPTRAPRFRTIDGLRGIAAASVVVFHYHVSIIRAAPHWLPTWAAVVANLGWLGVDIFFVISGFVIAFSVRGAHYSARYLGRFALRRSIRLDPLYWFAIAVELVLLVVSVRLFPSLTSPFPSIPKILSHLIYAQSILGYGDILPIFWTLCFEIQFYVAFVTLLVLWQKAKARLSAPVLTGVVRCMLAALFVISLVLRYGGLELPVPGIALVRWFQFFLGVLTWWVVSGAISFMALGLAYAAVVATLVIYHVAPYNILPVLVSGFIVAVARADRLDTVLSNRPLQFLGKISYSLYLFHGPVGERWISLVERLAGPSFGVAWAWFAFASAIGISLVFSTLAWKLIELPTMRLSKRIRLESRQGPSEPLPTDVPTLVTS